MIGDGSLTITSGSTLQQAGPDQITFLANAKYALLVADTRAGAVLVAEPMETRAAQVVVRNPYYAFTQILVLLHGHRQHKLVGISPGATIDPSAHIHPEAHVHGRVTISENVRIGAGTVVYPGTFIGPDVEIGENTVLHANVVVYENVKIGNRVLIHANTTIGQDGLGFATEAGVHHKIPHIAGVIIEDDVEIGANAGIERGSLQDTVICQGSKIGSQVAVGHGVRVGAHTLMVAQTGVAGSTRIGHHCIFAGQVGVAGHLEIGDNVTIAAKSGVSQNIPDGERIFGYPAFEMGKAVEAYSLVKRLPEMRRTVRALEERIKALESAE